MLGLFRGVGKMFGSKESTKEDSISDQD